MCGGHGERLVFRRPLAAAAASCAQASSKHSATLQGLLGGGPWHPSAFLRSAPYQTSNRRPSRVCGCRPSCRPSQAAVAGSGNGCRPRWLQAQLQAPSGGGGAGEVTGDAGGAGGGDEATGRHWHRTLGPQLAHLSTGVCHSVPPSIPSPPPSPPPSLPRSLTPSLPRPFRAAARPSVDKESTSMRVRG